MSAAADAHERARSAGLPQLGRRPPLRDYGTSLWHHRHLLLELSRSRYRAANEENRLGPAWNVIRPLLNALVYGTIFGLLLQSSTRPANFIPFLVIGVFMFQYFAGCLNDGAKSITGNLGLVRTLHFPRALLPLSTVLQQVYALLPVVVTAVVVVLVFGDPPTWRWFLMIPALVLMTLFNLGVAMVAARVTLHVRDVAQLLPFVTRLLFYISGIFYSIQRVGLPGPVELVARINPVQVYLTLIRSALLEEVDASWRTWLLGAVWGLLTLVAGAVFFWRAEEEYGRA